MAAKNTSPDPDKSPAAVPPPESVDPPAGLPDDLKPMPKPDDFKKLPPSAQEPGGSAGAGVLKRSKKSKKKDGSKKGCGCGTALVFLIVLLAGILVGGTFWLMQPFQKAGFIEQRARLISVTEAPTEKTLYLSDNVNISAGQVDVEIGVFAPVVELNGTFTEDVYIRAGTVHCTPGTVFQKDLHVFAIQYVNEGTVVGELKGKIMRQKASVDSP